MSFRRAGPAISSLRRAVAPGGGSGLKTGDVRLFQEHPGVGWIADDETIPFAKKYLGILPGFGVSPVADFGASNTAVAINSDGNHLVVGGFTSLRYTTLPFGAWTNVTTSSNVFISDIAHGNGTWVLIGRVNAEGKIWSRVGAPASLFSQWVLRYTHSAGYYTGVTEHEGTFVAWQGTGVTGDSIISVSTDGVSWTNKTIPTKFSGVTWFDGKWVAISNNSALFSTDLVSWTTVSGATFSNLNNITVHGGRVLIGTTDGRIYTSTDLVNWTIIEFPVTSSVHNVWYHPALELWFARMGSTIYISLDLVEWIPYLLGFSSAGRNSIPYGNDLIVAPNSGVSLFTTALRGFQMTDRSPSTAGWKPYTKL